MIRYRFGQDDLLRTRFAIAPLMELVGVVYVLRNPDRYVLHRGWAEWASPRAERLELTRTDPPWDPALVYPPPGIADLWTPDAEAGDALEALLGRRRAQVLRLLDRPAATLELAWRLGVSPGSVSGHLTTLRRVGLVMRRREGRRVVYARTTTGDDLRARH